MDMSRKYLLSWYIFAYTNVHLLQEDCINVYMINDCDIWVMQQHVYMYTPVNIEVTRVQHVYHSLLWYM